MLKVAVDQIRHARPFDTVAYVMLPDHLHVIWQLPRGDCDYSVRWKRIKEEFTLLTLAAGHDEGCIRRARQQRGERGVWQRRYWEHTVRDEDDLKRCIDYVHWNPKKHGYVEKVHDWPWSSFHRLVELGEYGIDWGGADPVAGYDDPEWGET